MAYNLVMEIEKLLKSQREQILAIARKNGAYNVRVFGSVARGEARPDSDIDFLVKLEAGRSLLDLARLLRELQTLLGLPVDVVTEAGLRPRIRPQVLKDARPLSVIGEACRSLSNEFQAHHANVPWADIIGMRNILVHHYFGIDEDAVWSVVEKDIPELKFNIEAILKSLEED